MFCACLSTHAWTSTWHDNPSARTWQASEHTLTEAATTALPDPILNFRILTWDMTYRILWNVQLEQAHGPKPFPDHTENNKYEYCGSTALYLGILTKPALLSNTLVGSFTMLGYCETVGWTSDAVRVIIHREWHPCPLTHDPKNLILLWTCNMFAHGTCGSIHSWVTGACGAYP